MSLARSLAKNTVIQVLGKVVSTALGVVIIGMLTRELGQAGFGAYSTAMAYLQIFALLLDMGLNVTFIALLGEHADDPAYERRCVSALFTLRIVVAFVVLGILAPTVAFLLPYPLALKLTILALAGSFIFPGINQVVIGVQQKHLRMTASAVAENVGRVVLLAGFYVAHKYGLGLVPLMWMISFSSLTVFVFNILAARSYGNFFWNWDTAFWKIALIRSWPVGVSIIFNVIYYKADTLILERFRPLAEVGVYGAAYRVLELLITVPFMYAGVLLPVLAHAWRKNQRKELGILITHSLEVMILLIAPLIAGTIVLGGPILGLVAGREFTASGDVLKVLILAVAVIYINTVISHVVVAIDKQRKMLPAYIIVALLTLAGYLLLIPIYGMWAAAWLTVFSEVAISISNLWITHREVPIRLPLRIPSAAVGASCIMGIILWFLRDLWIGIPILTAPVVYLLALYLLGGISKHTIRDLLSINKKPIASL
ncbi:MAG: flippase [Patescibacteria group bacterium]